MTSETTQWMIFAEPRPDEPPMPHDRARILSHRRRSNLPLLPDLAGIAAAVLVILALMVYGVAVLWDASVPTSRLLPALAAVTLAGVGISLVTCQMLDQWRRKE